MRFKRLLSAAIFAALFAGIACTSSAASSSNLELGQPAPPLVLTTLDGNHISTHDLLGHVVIVTFWATWCGPCHTELPLLSDYVVRHQQQGVRVLAFSLDSADALPEVRAMASKLSFPSGLLGSAWAGGYGRIWRIPVSFVIGRDGRLVDNGWKDPEPTWTAQRLRRIVDPLLVP